MYIINVRELQRVIKKWTIQGNWNKRKKTKTTTAQYKEVRTKIDWLGVRIMCPNG
jgi:hypothetical protein